MAYNILIVDDNELTVTFLESILIENGYGVEILRQGKDLVAMAKKYLPHIILMDIRLPDMNGQKAVEQLQKESSLSDIPVIFVSANIESEKEGSTINVNNREYPAFSKAIPTSELLKLIQATLISDR